MHIFSKIDSFVYGQEHNGKAICIIIIKKVMTKLFLLLWNDGDGFLS